VRDVNATVILKFIGYEQGEQDRTGSLWSPIPDVSEYYNSPITAGDFVLSGVSFQGKFYTVKLVLFSVLFCRDPYSI
jgi:hypothetical protein